MNRSQAIQIYNTLFFPPAARVFAQYEGVPPHLEDGPEPDRGPGKRRAAALLRSMADALDPLADDTVAAILNSKREVFCKLATTAEPARYTVTISPSVNDFMEQQK